MLDYLDGKPIRKIADAKKCSSATIFRKLESEIKALPHSNDITKRYCNRFCGILVVDGKYVKVRGYETKIPLLWGIDYTTHDIPVHLLARSESFAAWLKYFGYLKTIKYPMQLLVCDDNENIRRACEYMFPNVEVQLCQVHFLENIKRALQVRADDTYKEFTDDLKKELFSHKKNLDVFRNHAYKLFRKYVGDETAIRYLIKIDSYAKELTAASYVRRAPKDTNLIELYNSHIEARLKPLKGFKSFTSAKQWLNAYILRRRCKPFTDCSKKFSYLNGTTSIEKTKKKNNILPHSLN